MKRGSETNYCGDCARWNPLPPDRQETGLLVGLCDKIPNGTRYYWEDENGEIRTSKFYRETFEDECYDYDMGCFEPKEGGEKT